MMNDQKGFTLVEVVISTAIIVIVSGAILQLFVSHVRAAQATENFLVVSEHNQRGLQKMAEELRGTDYQLVNVVFSGSQGAKTLGPLIPGGSSFSVTLYSQITFKRIIGFDIMNGSQLWSTDITYSVNTTTKQLQRVQDGVTKIFASYVTGISFYNSPDGSIGVILTNTYGDMSGPTPIGAEVSNRIEVFPINAGSS